MATEHEHPLRTASRSRDPRPSVAPLPEQLVQLWRLPKVEAETGLKRSAIYRLIQLGKFPPPVKLTDRASAWVSTEVQAWIVDRITQSRSADRGTVAVAPLGDHP